MDREALEREIARRLLDHIGSRTTDLADDVMELPTDVYSDAHQEEELEVLFRDRPLVLCLSGALPGPGTFRTVDLCGTPLLLTRDAGGRVRALANACRHRGVRVADGAGEARKFTCPFHAWTYELSGRLVRVPVDDAFAGMCKESKGLVELPVAEGRGLIVGRLRPGPAVDIDDYLGPGLADELGMLDFADWAPHGEPHVHRVGANWKVTLDTFRENYHFNYLHRRTLASYAHGGVLTFDAFGPHLRNCSALRSIDELLGRPEDEWGDVTRHFSYQYQLFPNTSLTFDSRHIELWQILPVDARTSEVVHTAYLRPGLSAEEQAKVTEMAPWICDTVVDGEDFWVAGRTEPGVRTGLLGTVVFGRNEPAPQHLHRGFADALAAAREHGPAR
ncbi:aromatic ring-hydroxylating dioxygenase subunit alpha [Actinomadura sp. WMMB 499]|uniref:aromatic ring-hydroxylating oxygenase subunit alpha n=1 Tax=Actinomadura sp. WMMB 499 TaxID=1219491 RepID=UPI001248463E|nr:SRPBCC family protein [Actinomadura sp. WMMB 499]QFG20323.1 Rieske 2Fe-2S domain-containing protein [Actinomadura sp. WMMB 499]